MKPPLDVDLLIKAMIYTPGRPILLPKLTDFTLAHRPSFAMLAR